MKSWQKGNPDSVDPSCSECERCLYGALDVELNEETWLCGLVSLGQSERVVCVCACESERWGRKGGQVDVKSPDG